MVFSLATNWNLVQLLAFSLRVRIHQPRKQKIDK